MLSNTTCPASLPSSREPPARPCPASTCADLLPARSWDLRDRTGKDAKTGVRPAPRVVARKGDMSDSPGPCCPLTPARR
ncbi:hypothetical protein GCM10010428_33730 [Actinosynnema pretiosum subsp. pretiosum]